MPELDILPVLLGADLNCYNVARAFHEAYGVVSRAFGRYAAGETMYSRIVDFSVCEKLDDPKVAVEILLDLAGKNPGKKKVLMGCTDDYVNLIMRNRDSLSPYYAIPYPDAELAGRITLKSNFYDLCRSTGVDHPETVTVDRNDPRIGDLPFPYPVIVKPSSSILYWKHPFEGMKKVYRASSKEEAQKIVDRIYESGYPEKIVVQDTIPGEDANMYVLTAYCGKDARVRAMCLGHVLLEEHTPRGLGNHCAIVTSADKSLYERFRSLLEGLNYTGFANFDIKFDPRDSSFRAFEINTRQGRSNYYMTAAGMNIARLVVDDLILDKPQEPLFNEKEIYWRYIPDKIVKKYVSDETLKKKAFALKKAGSAYSSLRYRFDLKANPKRYFYTVVHERRHIGKFDRYLGKAAEHG